MNAGRLVPLSQAETQKLRKLFFEFLSLGFHLPQPRTVWIVGLALVMRASRTQQFPGRKNLPSDTLFVPPSRTARRCAPSTKNHRKAAVNDAAINRSATNSSRS